MSDASLADSVLSIMQTGNVRQHQDLVAQLVRTANRPALEAVQQTARVRHHLAIDRPTGSRYQSVSANILDKIFSFGTAKQLKQVQLADCCRML